MVNTMVGEIHNQERTQVGAQAPSALFLKKCYAYDIFIYCSWPLSSPISLASLAQLATIQLKNLTKIYKIK